MLDCMNQVSWVERHADHAIVEVGAGCHLGRDPYDPTNTSRWSNSLNHQLQVEGYALDGLGGISHQTVAGFVATGSSGGSVAHAAHQNVVGIEFVDGRGEVHRVSAGDELFEAVGVSMGLLGVVTMVWVRVVPSYAVEGVEITTPTADAPMDMFGSGSEGTASLATYFRQTPYARLLWWPQREFDRVQTWEARRISTDDYEHRPFRILTALESATGSLLMTLLGHIDDLSQVPAALESVDWYRRMREALDAPVEEDINAAPLPPTEACDERAIYQRLQGRLARSFSTTEPGPLSVGAARLLTAALRKIIEGALPRLASRPVSWALRWLLAHSIDDIIGEFVDDETKHFEDTWLAGLPMDNQMDDKLWGTAFTELWFDLDQAEVLMQRLREYFDTGDARERYRRTGPFAFEIYAAPASRFWLSPGHGRDSVRFNAFWFETWPGDPADKFDPFWELLADMGFRLHWGKHLPAPSDRWRQHYRQHLPMFDRFLQKRAELDPKQVFATDYWREHLGIAPP